MTASRPRQRVRFGKTYSLEEIEALVLAALQIAKQEANGRLSNGEIQIKSSLRRFTAGDISIALRSLRDNNLVVMHGEGSRATWSVTQLGLAALASRRVGDPGPRAPLHWTVPKEI